MKVNLIDYDDLGNAICKIDNKICFVKRGIKEEVVEIKIIKDNKKYSTANIEKIVKESDKRIKPVCKYYDKCGGCNFLHLVKEEENLFKINKAKKFFSRCDEFFETKEYNYRNKVKLHVKNGKIGYYEVKSNNLIPINYCYLLSENINKVIKLLNKLEDSSFNGEIIIRENYNHEIMLIVDGICKFINDIKEYNFIQNIIYNKNIIKGNDYFIEKVLNYKFKVSYDSFFQVNRLGLEKIFSILSNFLENKKINTALDLYSGTSVLGIHLSKYVNRVISVEVNSSATNDAKYNLDLNNINNLDIINGLVEDNIDKFSNIDLVLIDPSRGGLDKKTISYLKRIKSKYLIYIACGIDSLKRDLKEINDIYNLDALYLVDMFPRTNNVESVAIFNLKNNF